MFSLADDFSRTRCLILYLSRTELSVEAGVRGL